ncbi:hypothetical protein JB92DRAFT_2824904 [Gautieria morchelliformis]|nr:hypothetical protein JB92DRAFT_2824904 [Gautieria morchelliformis]
MPSPQYLDHIQAALELKERCLELVTIRWVVKDEGQWSARKLLELILVIWKKVHTWKNGSCRSDFSGDSKLKDEDGVQGAITDKVPMQLPPPRNASTTTAAPLPPSGPTSFVPSSLAPRLPPSSSEIDPSKGGTPQLGHSYGMCSHISQMLCPRGASRPQGSHKVSSPSQGSTLALEYHAKIKNLHGDNQSLKYELQQAHLRIQLAEAQKSVAKALATIRALENQQLRTQLYSQSEKKKHWCLNTSAHLLTAPKAESKWQKQNKKEVQSHEQEEQKKAEKTKTAQAHGLQRMEDGCDKVFAYPLASYKLKDDLRDIPATLKKAKEGTVVELFMCIKKFLEDNPAIAIQENCRGRKQVLSVSGGGTASTSGSAAMFPPGPNA